jgi:hypothetical protein
MNTHKCRIVLNGLLGQEIDYAKVRTRRFCVRSSARLSLRSRQVDKFTADFNLSASDVKAVLGAISFILTNAAKYVAPRGIAWSGRSRVRVVEERVPSTPSAPIRALRLRYDVDMGVLINELCQLGLPKEHSESIGRCEAQVVSRASLHAHGNRPTA